MALTDHDDGKITKAIKFGDNATILTMENDKKLVFKNSVTSTFVTLMRSQ
jgi:hypothetical protein